MRFDEGAGEKNQEDVILEAVWLDELVCCCLHHLGGGLLQLVDVRQGAGSGGARHAQGSREGIVEGCEAQMGVGGHARLVGLVGGVSAIIR